MLSCAGYTDASRRWSVAGRMVMEESHQCYRTLCWLLQMLLSSLPFANKRKRGVCVVSSPVKAPLPCRFGIFGFWVRLRVYIVISSFLIEDESVLGLNNRVKGICSGLTRVYHACEVGRDNGQDRRMWILPIYELWSAYMLIYYLSSLLQSQESFTAEFDYILGSWIAIKCTLMDSIYPPKSPEHLAPSLEARRTSQRQPLAYQQCAKAKTRCDKTIPCYRCRRRGLHCQRQDVIVSRQSKRGARPTTTARSLKTPPATYPASHTRYTDTSNLHLSSRPTARLTVGDFAAHGEFQDSPTAIEGLAWGRHQCHSYPHSDCRQFKPLKSASEAAPLVFPNVLEALPSVSLARRLVDYHIQNLCWYHNVLHAPTFLHQCEGFWNEGITTHDQWIAVYCAVLSSAAWTLSNSTTNDSTPGMVELAEAMMRQTKAVLYDTDFMGRHSVFAVQAIGIISMVAHSFGESDLMATLVNAGIRIAQCLGLHRVPDDVSEELSAEERSDVS